MLEALASVRFLRERRGIDVSMEPRMHGVPGAHHADDRIDCESMEKTDMCNSDE